MRARIRPYSREERRARICSASGDISSLLICILSLYQKISVKVLREGIWSPRLIDELKQKLDHPKKSILVEALPADQFHKLHLPGAINVPAGQERTLAPELLPHKDVEVIVYCAGPTCHASHQAAAELTATRLFKRPSLHWRKGRLAHGRSAGDQERRAKHRRVISFD